MIARFRRDGVEVDLDKGEYIFVSRLSYVIDGARLADHDFANILGMTREGAEALLERLGQAEPRGKSARARGVHLESRPARI